jgi:hypothetical protein
MVISSIRELYCFDLPANCLSKCPKVSPLFSKKTLDR